MRPAIQNNGRLARACGLLCVWLLGCGGPDARSPEAALDTFELPPGFRIELAAAEPDIADPAAIAFDAEGRMYVAENSGYPLDTESGAGRVKLLEDTDGDGKPDKTTLFAGGLTMPTGVMAWKQGVLVTDAPDLLYLEDSDGDGKSDVRRTVLTGFAFTNPQHTVSTPVYGLDNWIYLAYESPVTAVVFDEKFGDPGGDIYFPDQPEARLTGKGRCLRFKPETHEIEWLSGAAQFGFTFDEFGRLFANDNTRHIMHEVMAARYLRRNPALRLPHAWEVLPAEGTPIAVYPITKNPRFELFTDAGRMTSAAGLSFYLGGRFPSSYDNIALVAEPAHNLVHHDVVEPRGVTFTAHPAGDKKEFLASTDPWFRPVNFATGPDGALYLADYYREVVEHPEWTSAEVYESDAIYRGKDRGRIYRIAAQETDQTPPGAVNLAEASAQELAAHLGSPNIWRRRTAQRLLMERKPAGAAAAVKGLLAETDSAAARAHALWTLDGLGELDLPLLEKALEDASPGVRENALILAEKRLEQTPELGGKILGLARDQDPRVRFQALCTLGEINSREARGVRDELLFSHLEDEWMQAAALSWPIERATRLYSKAIRRAGAGKPESGGARRLFRRLGTMIAAGGRGFDIQRMLGTIAGYMGTENNWWRAASLEGLAQGLDEKTAARIQRVDRQTLGRLLDSSGADLRRAALAVLKKTGLNGVGRGVLARAARTAANDGADPERRAEAIDLLAVDGPGKHEELLAKLISPHEPEAVQKAAVRAYGGIEGAAPARFLLERFREMPGAVRTEAVRALTASGERVRMLLDAVEAEKIPRWMTGRPFRLMQYPDEELRRRARELLAWSDEEREKLLKEYETALEREGDAAQGREVFERECAKCHSFRGEGHEVGPDLASVSSRPAKLLLGDILLPNRSIAPEYESYVVRTRQGETLEGVMGPQAPDFITLLREEGERDVVERGDIAEIYAANLSAMPDDLHQRISVQQMADLLRYIKTAN